MDDELSADGTSTVAMEYARVISLRVESSSGVNEKTSRLLHWFLGAPGILGGTAVALAIVYAVVSTAGDANVAVVFHDHAKYTYAVGCLFFRALTCVVVPKIVSDVALACADVVRAHRMFHVRRRVVVLAILTTLLAVVQAMFWGTLFSSYFTGQKYTFHPAALGLNCPWTTNSTSPTVLVWDQSRNALVCDVSSTPTSFLISDDVFQVRLADIKRWKVYASAGTEIQALVHRLFPSNIVLAITRNDVVSVVLFAIALGVALGVYDEDSGSENRIVKVLRELNGVMETMISYVVTVTPIALIPLIVGPLISGTHNYDAFTQLGYFLVAYLAACIMHVCVVLPLLLLLSTCGSPVRFAGFAKEALLYGLACSSSRKSLPVAMRALDKHVAQPKAARFGVIVGTSLNRNGAAIYITLSLVWIFFNAGLQDRFTPVKLVLVGVCSVVCSVAVAPVRSGGVAIVVSLWAMLSGIPTPYAYSLLLVAECIMDPIATTLNMAGNLVVAFIHDDAASSAPSGTTGTNNHARPGQAQRREDTVEAHEVTTSRLTRWFLGAPGPIFGAVVALVIVYALRDVHFHLTVANTIIAAGNLYFRAMECVVIPLAFIDIILNIAEFTHAFRTNRLRWHALGLAVLTTGLAIGQAFFWNEVMGSHFDGGRYVYIELPFMELQCPSSNATSALFLRSDPTTGRMSCAADSTTFYIGDNVFPVKKGLIRRKDYASSGAELQSGVRQLVPSNLFQAFITHNLLSLAMFALMLGVALGFSGKQLGHETNRLRHTLVEVSATLETMLSYIITVTPIAVIPMITGPIFARTHTMNTVFPSLGVYAGVYIAGAAVHLLVVLPIVSAVFSKMSPARFLKTIKEALWYGFASGSSRKSLPVTMRCLDPLVQNRVAARAALKIGTCFNKNGGAFHLALSLMWVFHNSGLKLMLTPVKLVVIAISVLLGSMGVAPVRNGAVPVVLVIFTTLTDLPAPYAYSYLMIAETFIDPISTVMNIMGNAVVAHVVGRQANAPNMFAI
ncbi:hypothetical protein ACHHYP_02440 [Achlya hypogyna]|uniref:Amino acid transporter n=1 Tax=Achlya hypogyna TaxID=1202772 RepID=A0A1V9Z6L8_ACHHY|nr:hypothetical protein ACHHYP_02440 [Achlya hypogyna]